MDDVAADALERTRRLRCGRRVEAHLPDELLTVPMDGLLIDQCDSGGDGTAGRFQSAVWPHTAKGHPAQFRAQEPHGGAGGKGDKGP